MPEIKEVTNEKDARIEDERVTGWSKLDVVEELMENYRKYNIGYYIVKVGNEYAGYSKHIGIVRQK